MTLVTKGTRKILETIVSSEASVCKQIRERANTEDNGNNG